MSYTEIKDQVGIITASVNGKHIQYWDCAMNEWVEKTGDTWQFGCVAYRVKPDYELYNASAVKRIVADDGFVELKLEAGEDRVTLSLPDLRYLLELGETS